MNWADYAILAVLSVSALISFWRGFTREALSLLAWLAAFWVAIGFSDVLAMRFAKHVAASRDRFRWPFRRYLTGRRRD
jgi:membrane protein required for colicin V production